MRTLSVLWLLSGLALAEPSRMVLLDVQHGELPQDASAKVALSTDHAQKEGGVSLKVTLGEGAFGQSNAKKKDWAGYRYFKFHAFNPQDRPLALYLATRDKETTGWATRGDIGFSLAPGASEVALDLSTLKRNQSDKKMDLSGIMNWYIASEEKNAVVYLGDIWLEGEDKAAKPEEGKPRLEGQPQGKKIVLEGKIRIELDRVQLEGLAEAKEGEAARPQAPAAPEKKSEKLMLLDTNAGQLPAEHSAEVTISEEHAKELGGKSMKAVFKKDQVFGVGYWGAGGPANWQPYNVLRVDAFNPSDQAVAFYMGIRDTKTGYENRCDLNFRLAPGLNKIELPIQALVSHAGNQLDKASITQWYVPCDQDATVYFANFRLEKE